MQVDLSGFSIRLFCFVQAKTVCMYSCMYFLAALVIVCVDVMVMSSNSNNNNVYLKSNIQTSSIGCTYKPIQ